MKWAIACSMSFIFFDQAILLNVGIISPFLSEQPLLFLLNHLSQAWRQWKSQMKTWNSMIIKIRQIFQVFSLFLSDKKLVLVFPFVWLRKTSENCQIWKIPQLFHLAVFWMSWVMNWGGFWVYHSFKICQSSEYTRVLKMAVF